MDAGKEQQQISNPATELYRQIGLICSGDEATVDGPNGSAAATGKNELFHVVVRSQMEQWQEVSRVWHVTVLTSRRTIGDEYVCRISEDGDVFYSDADNYESIWLDTSLPGNHDLLRSFIRQLEKTDFELIEPVGETS